MKRAVKCRHDSGERSVTCRHDSVKRAVTCRHDSVKELLHVDMIVGKSCYM